MRVLVLHNEYQIPGGEDVVVRNEVNLLRDHGHQVRLELVSNHDIRTVGDKAQAWISAAFDYSKFRKRIPELLHGGKPEVVHIHNFFPVIGPSVSIGLAEAGIPVVQTLHNYRTLCANALLTKNGQVCEKCAGGQWGWAVAHRCYRDSAVASFAAARIQVNTIRSRKWLDATRKIIVLSEFSKAKFIESGLPSNKLVVKPNFVPDRFGQPKRAARSGVLFVGRLSPEKGLVTLIEAWRNIDQVQLTVIGDGPQRELLQQTAPGNVFFSGWLQQSAVAEHLSAAALLVVPSTWYEGLPMVVLEAYAAGVPVVAADIGTLADVVQEGVTGFKFKPNNAADLTRAIRESLQDPKRLERMGMAARSHYLAKYTPEMNISQLDSIYKDVLHRAEVQHNEFDAHTA